MEVEIEVEGEDGSKLPFGENEKAVFGRGCGFDTHDRTVSRRHVSFQLQHSDSDVGNGNARVSFEVIGKNPFWVYDGESLRLFRKLEKGHLQVGHRFCFSPSAPLWFTLNHFQPQPLDHIHLSEIDPVKEFGFLVMGHEFDHYPKGMIQHTKNWEWFLEEPRKDSDHEEDFQKERRKMRGKRKMGRVNEDDDDDDDEWTGESEDDKDLVATMRKGKLPRYSTRSKVNKGGNKDTKASQNSKQKRAASVDETVEEDDETLGGFIVADEDNDKQEEEDDDDEEEFEDDNDDDDDESDD